jgi:cytochrome c oxidase assembly protein subunit 11
MSDDVEHKRDSNNRLTLKLLAFALGSFVFGFALVPFYDVLCDITGFGNQKALAEARVAVEQPDDSRTITIDFVADLPSVGNWEFRPTVASMQVHPGRLYQTEFFAHNLTGHETMAQAVPNIAPGNAAGYFRKTECFCFTPQHFNVNEQRPMAVRRAFTRRSLTCSGVICVVAINVPRRARSLHVTADRSSCGTGAARSAPTRARARLPRRASRPFHRT